MSKICKIIGRILVAIMIFTQVIIAAFYTVVPTRGLLSLSDMTNVCDNGGFLLGSIWMSILGWICRLFSIRPLTLALDIMPFVSIPACYIAYALLIRELDEEDTGMTQYAMLLITLLQMFGYQSEAFIPFTLLLNWFSGQVFVIHFLLPLLFFLLVRNGRIRRKKAEAEAEWRRENGVDDTDEEALAVTNEIEPWEEADMKFKWMNVRNLSIAFIVLALLVCGSIFLLNRKINNLHQATVNLQQAIADKGDFVEFVDNEDALKGYLLIGKEGSVSVIGGGGEKEGAALYDLIIKYSDHVSSWYLTDEQGAYDYCKNQGITVEKLYQIKGIEEIQ